MSAPPAPPASDRARAAYVRFRSLEVNWLCGLSVLDQSKVLGGRPSIPDPFQPNHVVVSGEVGLLLAGVKPCVVFSHGRWTEYAAQMHAAVLRPWFSECGADLGLELAQVTGASAPEHHPGFRGAWVLLAPAHPGAPASRAAFLSNRNRLPNKQAAVAFGYPAPEEPNSQIYYMDADDAPYRNPCCPNVPLCCCVVLQYSAPPSSAAAVGAHFRACSDAVRDVLHMSLSLDVEGLQHWTDAALADLLRTAFGSVIGVARAVKTPPFPRNELRMWGWLEPRMAGVLRLV